jgi:uncharacterized protein (TIGR03083 family)
MQVPIQTIHLFPALDQKLIELLRSLTPDEWHKATRAKLWRVKDIAAHLLDGNIRTLSMSRDQYFGENPGDIQSYAALVTFLNGLNADWVKAARRISPEVLTDLLETTGVAYIAHLQSLDPFSSAIFPVDWAGEKKSATWFHIAREYTEKWHHQQQIREAVNRPGITSRELYYPVLDTFMQALPHCWRNIQRAAGTRVLISIEGEAGGMWQLQRSDEAWKLTRDIIPASETEVVMHQEIAWKLLTKGLSREETTQAVFIRGDRELGEPILSMVAVMA